MRYSLFTCVVKESGESHDEAIAKQFSPENHTRQAQDVTQVDRKRCRVHIRSAPSLAVSQNAGTLIHENKTKKVLRT
jgi:hypothetical protein